VLWVQDAKGVDAALFVYVLLLPQPLTAIFSVNYLLDTLRDSLQGPRNIHGEGLTNT